jgi:citrate lyase gamma subunit
MVDKAINIDPVNLTAQKDSIDVKRSSHVEVEKARAMKKTQFQVLMKKQLQVHEVKIRLQGCLIDILITKIDTSTNQCIHRNK